MVKINYFVILILVLVTSIGFIFIKKLNNNFLKIKNNINWKWDDKWSNKDKLHLKKKESLEFVPKLNPLDFEKKEIEPKEVEPKEIKIDSYEDAVKESERTGKPILLFFTADWCGYCQKMKNNTMKNEKIEKILENYILFYIDVDKNRDLSKKYYIKSLPTLIITNHEEKNIKNKKGYVESYEFYNWLNDSNILK